MDKVKALNRLVVIEAEAAKLRAIVAASDKPAKLEYDGHMMYVFIHNDGTPYLLAGKTGYECFRWYCYGYPWLTEQGWANPHKTGQEALNYVAHSGEVYEFTDGLEGLTFFFDAYKAHKV